MDRGSKTNNSLDKNHITSQNMGDPTYIARRISNVAYERYIVIPNQMCESFLCVCVFFPTHQPRLDIIHPSILMTKYIQYHSGL
jgi:hypothetical protein